MTPDTTETTNIDDTIDCEGHGKQPATIVCEHLAESQPEDEPIGFHWFCDEEGLTANCDECEAEADADGFLPEDYVTEHFVAICRECFIELAAVNDVTRADIEAAEAGARSTAAN